MKNLKRELVMNIDVELSYFAYIIKLACLHNILLIQKRFD